VKLKQGQKAPQFSLPDQDGIAHTLKNYLGAWVLIYFYPKDDTPGCTKEACGFRDNLPKLNKLKATVLGISADSITKHRKFADKYSLPFTLLADEDKTVLKAYGVWQEKSMYGRKYMGIMRTSFLIDPKGKIAKIYEKVKPDTHPQEVISYLRELR